MEVKKLLVIAEGEISRILEKLELDTGMIVEELRIRDVDVSTMGDDRPQLLRHPTIELKPLPGTKWS